MYILQHFKPNKLLYKLPINVIHCPQLLSEIQLIQKLDCSHYPKMKIQPLTIPPNNPKMALIDN